MNDFSHLNDLPQEVKLLIINGQALIDETKTTLQDRKLDFDLTSKRQLLSDCKTVEKNIKVISKGKVVSSKGESYKNIPFDDIEN